jgi:hypothetical protein
MADNSSPEFYHIELCDLTSESEGSCTPSPDHLNGSVEVSVPEDGTYEYCTLRCLEGLRDCGDLDHHCPNTDSHGDVSHNMAVESLVQYIRIQLYEDHYRGVELLSYSGRTRSAVFKMTLLPERYTVVLKAATKSSAYYQKREIQMYERLRDVQGYYVPYCLGEFEMDYPLSWGGVSEPMHFIVLAWAGHSLDCVPRLTNHAVYQNQSPTTLDAQIYLETGVKHLRPLPRHICWNEEIKKPMMIDFSWALAIKPDDDLLDFGIHPWDEASHDR